MSLTRVPLEFDEDVLPDDVAALLADAEDRIERFTYDHRDDPIPAFVPSDFPLVWRALCALRDRRLTTGERFLEWGAGFGVVAAMAAMAGFECMSIEIEPDLVIEAERFTEDHELDVEHLQGSFVPRMAQEIVDEQPEMSGLQFGGADPLEPLGLGADDFDVIYAFPWPGEQDVFEALFDRSAAVGAILVTFHGVDGVVVQRKV